MVKNELKEQLNTLALLAPVIGRLGYLHGCKILSETQRLFAQNSRSQFNERHLQYEEQDKSVNSRWNTKTIDRQTELLALLKDLEKFQKIGKKYFNRDYKKFEPFPDVLPSVDIAWILLEINAEIENLHDVFNRELNKMTEFDRLGPQVRISVPFNKEVYFIYSNPDGNYAIETATRRLLAIINQDQKIIIQSVTSVFSKNEDLQKYAKKRKNVFACSSLKDLKVELETFLKERDTSEALYQRVQKASEKFKKKWFKIEKKTNILDNNNETLVILNMSALDYS